MPDGVWWQSAKSPFISSEEGGEKKKPANEEVFVGGGWRTPQAVGALRCGERLRIVVFDIR